MVSTGALRAAIRGALTGEMAPAGRLIGYHATPHTLAPEPGAPLGRFRLDKVNTGEGAQAFGWGVPYIAGNFDVGDEYWRVFQRSLDRPRLLAERHLERTGGDRAKAIRWLREGAVTGDAPDSESWRIIDNAARVLEDPTFELPRARLYEVDIPESGYLDWDAPLSAQPETVRRAVDDLGVRKQFDRHLNGLRRTGHPESFIDRVAEGYADPKGERIYANLTDANVRRLRNFRGTIPALPPPMERADPAAYAASMQLREAGVPGIQYLDADSRGAGQGTHNYVMFDPGLAHIRAVKAALLAALVGGGALGAEEINA